MARNKAFSDEFENIDFNDDAEPEPVEADAAPDPEERDGNDLSDRDAQPERPPPLARPAADNAPDAGDNDLGAPAPNATPIEDDESARLELAAKQLLGIELPNAADYVEQKSIKNKQDTQFIDALWFHPEASETSKAATIAAAVASQD